MSFETITVERNEAVGVLTLNRPQSMNALCAAMLGETAEALNQFDADDSIRAVVLTGADGCFAAGVRIQKRNDFRRVHRRQKRVEKL